jgi:hypothetical protein
LRQRLDAELARLGITAPQNAVLLAVAGNPRISLERGGLIVRSPHPGHGRVIMTELTKAGQKAVAEQPYRARSDAGI